MVMLQVLNHTAKQIVSDKISVNQSVNVGQQYSINQRKMTLIL